jgi:hypothetical protein
MRCGITAVFMAVVMSSISSQIRRRVVTCLKTCRTRDIAKEAK